MNTNECCPPATTPATVTPPVEWCAGNKVLRFESGRIVERPIQNPIPDGAYANATVRTVGGCIVEITEGTNVVYSACDPCAVPPPPPPTVDVQISGDACNLLSFGGDGGLFAGASIISATNCLTVAGCGTAFSPFTLDLPISADAGNGLECRGDGLYSSTAGAGGGVNFNGCGITITNGLVTALPLPFQPVLDITSSNGSILLFRSVDGCSFDIQTNASGGGGVTIGGLGALLVAAPVDLPNPPTNGQFMAAVGAANPRAFWIFINGIGWREIEDSTSSPLEITV